MKNKDNYKHQSRMENKNKHRSRHMNVDGRFWYI
jgi:hypothetical protein